MSPRRSGWDYAQVRSSFLSDPEFQRLSRSCRNDRDFYAAVGLWTVALAQAWREDSDDVSEVMANYPRGAENLRAAQLVSDDGRLTGFAKWTETVRRVREQDSARKRGVQAPPSDSDGFRGTPVEFPRGVGVGEVVEDVRITTPKPPQAGARPRSRRKSGDTPRTRGANPRLLREGDEAKDAKVMAELAERTARWNAAHPSDPVGSILGSKP